MRNIKLTLEYDGTAYNGWQVQNKSRGKTVQGAIEKVLQQVLQERVTLVGSGRTDAGVHAGAQVANFKTRSSMGLHKLQGALNGLLPKDIAVLKAEEAASHFHSRFSAASKTYSYQILNRPSRSALLRHTAYFYPYALDVPLMRKECRVLLGRHDLRSFKGTGAGLKQGSAVRTISKLTIAKKGGVITVTIEANGFLYNMARNIIGTLLEIGRGRIKPGELKNILAARDRRRAGPTAPAHGLCLTKVDYERG